MTRTTTAELHQARAAGLRVDVTASVWNPPHTIGIRFTKRER